MLDKIIKFQSEIHDNENTISIYERIGRCNDKGKVAKLEDFLIKFISNIESILILSKEIDNLTFERFNNILESSNIENIVAELLYTINDVKSSQLVKREIARKTLVSIARLNNAIQTIIQKYESIQNNDDEIFKPSNINKDAIIEYLDQAIIGIEKATIQKEEKQKLIIYIKETRTEVIKESTTWKNVIGALVITAAIISGIADAEGAYKNINKAITHIMGSSIQKTIPSVFENLNIEVPTKQLSSNNDSSVIV